MRYHYLEREGRVLSHCALPSRSFSFDYTHVHPLKQGLHMLFALILLMSSMGLMYLTLMFVSDLQAHDAFCQHGSMDILDRDFKGAAYSGRMQGHDDE